MEGRAASYLIAVAGISGFSGAAACERRNPGGILSSVIWAVIGVGVAVFAVLLTACGRGGMVGSGTAAAQTRHVAAFSRIDLAGSNDVAVHVGGLQSVVVHADDNLLGQVITQFRGRTLVIGTRGSITTKTPMRVDISVPSLEVLTLSGSGALTAQNIQAMHVSVRLPGSGIIRASGTVEQLDVSLDGSGDAQLEQLVAHDVRAVLTGSGRIVTHARDSLRASVPGSGTIVYRGHPAHVTTSITGSGTITRQ
jgi:hypothetical protein